MQFPVSMLLRHLQRTDGSHIERILKSIFASRLVVGSEAEPLHLLCHVDGRPVESLEVIGQRMAERTTRKHRCSVQVWAGDHPGYFDETQLALHELRKDMLGASEEKRFLERWGFVFRDGPLPRLECHQSAASAHRSAKDRIESCEQAIVTSVIDAAWIGAREYPEVWEIPDGIRENYYMGAREFMQTAIRYCILPTDARTQLVPVDAKWPDVWRSRAIVIIEDTKDSFAAFETSESSRER
jgi:hypothetical protein